MGEEEVEFKKQKSLFKIVKNISVLNIAFSKTVLVLIKNECSFVWGSHRNRHTRTHNNTRENIRNLRIIPLLAIWKWEDVYFWNPIESQGDVLLSFSENVSIKTFLKLWLSGRIIIFSTVVHRWYPYNYAWESWTCECELRLRK